MGKTITIIFFVLLSTFAYSQQEKIKWYSIEEAEKLVKDNPRPMFY
jgi:hypothetical protein